MRSVSPPTAPGLHETQIETLPWRLDPGVGGAGADTAGECTTGPSPKPGQYNRLMAPDVWRLILSSPMTGPDNMALDEALLDSAGRGEGGPTLRAYSLDPPGVSICYARAVSPVPP